MSQTFCLPAAESQFSVGRRSRKLDLCLFRKQGHTKCSKRSTTVVVYRSLGSLHSLGHVSVSSVPDKS